VPAHLCALCCIAFLVGFKPQEAEQAKEK